MGGGGGGEVGENMSADYDYTLRFTFSKVG